MSLCFFYDYLQIILLIKYKKGSPLLIRFHGRTRNIIYLRYFLNDITKITKIYNLTERGTKLFVY